MQSVPFLNNVEGTKIKKEKKRRKKSHAKQRMIIKTHIIRNQGCIR